MKLTDKIVKALPVPDKGNIRTPDAEVKGFNAQVTAAGLRAFVLRYRNSAGKERQMTIGKFPTWNTVAARTEAKRLRRLVDQGIDPLEQEARERDEAITVADFWRRVYEPYHVPILRPSWARDVRSMMAHDILPRIGDRAVKDIDHADVAALHREITKRAPSRANRAKALISHFMGYAERPHVAEDGERVPALRSPGSNPTRGVALNSEDKRQRFLSPAEIARLAEALDKHSADTRAALVRFLLLTGCRYGEAANATWSQFDLGRGVWTKPSSHTKQKKEHVVPLSAPALLLLQQLHDANRSSPYLFPSSTGKPYVSIKHFWASVTKEAKLEGVRIHDLRHSFASVLASGGASLPLIGSLLGHSQAQTTARYSHLLDAVQREAVERAGAVISGQPSGEVVPIRQSR